MCHLKSNLKRFCSNFLQRLSSASVVFVAVAYLASFGSIAKAEDSLVGDWKLAPVAGALGVGPALGDTSWWASNADDVTTRACLFDDVFSFNADGSFANTMGDSTWLETWQGVEAEGCGAPVAPHDGSNAATYSYDAAAGTLTVVGQGAHVGLAKVVNGGESGVAENDTITYTVTELTADSMTLDIWIGHGSWRFVLASATAADDGGDAAPALDVTGDWRLAPEAGALGVGPAKGDISWWSNSADDVNTRYCLFDDVFSFNADGSFANTMGDATWLEGWQGVEADSCGAPVAPHDGSAAATYSYDAAAATLTVVGQGAHLGLAKVVNGAETGVAVDDTITYEVTELTADRMTLDINFGPGYWRFVLVDAASAAAPTAPVVEPEQPTTFDVTFRSEEHTSEL